MEHVNGIPLNESHSIQACEGALGALAMMQEEMARNASFLGALGAKDVTCARIASMSEPFFSDAEFAMRAQTSLKSKPLSTSDLYRLQCDIGAVLDEFRSADIPETLLHCDIGHGNVITNGHGPVFLDWAETAIGHPFLSAEHLLADFARLNSVSTEEQANLRDSYSAHWKNYVEPVKLNSVTTLAPAVAAFVYALNAWDLDRNRPDPTRTWPLIRSMLRRTRRELDQISEFIV